MLRAIALTVFSFIVVTLFAAQAALSSSLLPNVPTFMPTGSLLAQAAPAANDNPTAEPAGEQDETTTQPTEKAPVPKQENSNAPQTPKAPKSGSDGPYDTEAIQEFYKSLYGS